jgi:hypothetical protein
MLFTTRRGWVRITASASRQPPAPAPVGLAALLQSADAFEFLGLRSGFLDTLDTERPELVCTYQSTISWPRAPIHNLFAIHCTLCLSNPALRTATLGRRGAAWR